MPEHQEAVLSGVKTVAQLGSLFSRLRNERSDLQKAYRTAQRALKGLDSLSVVEDALGALRASVAGILAGELDNAVEIGLDQAQREVSIYSLPPVTGSGVNTGDALNSVLSVVDLQARKTRAVAYAGMDEDIVLGDNSRVGVISSTPVAREAAFWATGLAVLAYTGSVTASLRKAGVEQDFMRQAVAVVDGKTTRTCLNVHGQTTERDGYFNLTGTPRYADEMQYPPFHRGCRTSVILIRQDAIKDDVTERMREDARMQEKAGRERERIGEALYKVRGKQVLVLRDGRWRRLGERHRTNREAREYAAALNETVRV